MGNETQQEIMIGIRDGLIGTFDQEELQLLCFDLNVEYEDMPGETRRAKAQKIVEYFSRQGRLADLINYCICQRPNYTWPSDQVLESESVQIVRGNFLKTSKVYDTKCKILFLVADPTDTTRLRLGTELREIQEQLSLSKLRSKFVMVQRMSVRPADISQAILDEEPSIIHFMGHGTSTGELCFENESGQAQAVSVEALSALFELFSGKIDCVLLNACYSAVQANAIANYVPYIIGMNQAISDTSATSFSIGFYQALGAGKSIEEAYKLGCVQIQLQANAEHLTPVLIQKSEGQRDSGGSSSPS